MTARFQISWLDDPAFKDWLEEVPSDINRAKCKLCHTSFSLSNMGHRAVRSHASGKEHKKRQTAGSQTLPIKYFSVLEHDHKLPAPVSLIQYLSTATPTPVQQESSESSYVSPIASTSKGIKPFLLQESSIKGEILWCLHTIMTHKSMRIAEKDVEIFKMIFSDSEIAKKIKLKKTKIGYSFLYGIAPFFKNELDEDLTNCKYICIGFDEALNKISQKTQMDVNVRFWSMKEDQVCTRYYTSAFFGRSTAVEIRQNFRSCLSNLYVKKLIQISMDGPNVNLKFYRDIKEDLRSEDSVELLNVGTCGLHVLHGAFKRGIEATNWSLISFFRSLYYLFKDVPSRRALYTEYTGSSTFPQKFCSVRWLNNENVAERALEMLPHLKKFVDSAKKDEKEPTCSSYKIVSRAVEDELFGAKLAFFKSLTSQVEPFLKEFQTDVPLVPFLYTSLSSLLRDILSKFIKEDILNKVPVNKINIEKSLLPPSQIDIGYGTRSAIKKNRPKISDQDILNFRRSCIACFKALSEKLLEKSPLTFPLCKAVTCFDPNIAVNDKLAPKRISNLLTILEDSKLITSSTAEKAEREYMKICSEKSDEIKQYRRKTSRVDVFWRNIFRSSENCDNILSIMKIIMILYHGNANVERGFSINSECLVENLHEETLVAQRIVYDSMKTKVGDLRDFEISKSLIQSFKNARSALTEATKRKEKEILERESEMQKKKKAKMAAKELSNKILEIKENANKEVSALMEEMKTINAQLQ